MLVPISFIHVKSFSNRNSHKMFFLVFNFLNVLKLVFSFAFNFLKRSILRLSLIRFFNTAYRLYTVVPKLVKFIDNLTNWYVRSNRKRLKVYALVFIRKIIIQKVTRYFQKAATDKLNAILLGRK